MFWHRRKIIEFLRPNFGGDIFQLSASLAYTTLIALVPLITVVFSTLSLFPVFDEWTELIEQFIFQNFVPASGQVVSDYLQEFSSQAGQLTAIGLVVLLLTAVLLLATIEDAMNRIWKVHRGRSTGQRLMIYWTLVTLGPILIVASLAFSSSLLTNAFLNTSIESTSWALNYLIPPLPFLLEVATFVVLYYLVPNCRTRFVNALIGAVIAAILFEIAKIGFSLYVSEFNSYEVIYGTLGVIPIFLVWIYISWLVILIGAHYAARLEAAKTDEDASTTR
ncbi:MAG: UPF0761 membrane protein [marine bacterium B5-7]|nr:MAG: UPF0761 membrane protein [marine bacterium B5-7]